MSTVCDTSTSVCVVLTSLMASASHWLDAAVTEETEVRLSSAASIVTTSESTNATGDAGGGGDVGKGGEKPPGGAGGSGGGVDGGGGERGGGGVSGGGGDSGGDGGDGGAGR